MEKSLDLLIQASTELDQKGLHQFASEIDSVMCDIAKVHNSINWSSDDFLIKEAQLEKVAILRKDSIPETNCPFGLPISEGCSTVGELIYDMDTGKAEKKGNNKLLDLEATNRHCPYAQKILEKQDAVICSYGTLTEGAKGVPMYHASTEYPRLFSGFTNHEGVSQSWKYNDFAQYSIY